MSTRKNVVRTSTTTKKLPSTAAKSSTSKRDASKDRKKKTDVQSSEKAKAKQPATAKLKDSDSSNKSSEFKSTSDVKLSHKKLKSKPEVPLTATSNGVASSRYFPSKNMYTNALKSRNAVPVGKLTDEQAHKVARPNHTNTIKNKIPSDNLRAANASGRLVKPQVMKHSTVDRSKGNPSLEENQSDSSGTFERPRTATLRKGSIVNANIVGPDFPSNKMSAVKKMVEVSKSPSPKSESSQEDKYEEDFESYESDFEEYSSASSPTNSNDVSIENISSDSSSSSCEEFKREEITKDQKRAGTIANEDDKKFDSGHFDMPDYKRRQILDNIKESIEKENINLVSVNNNNPASLSDEGFEEQKSLQFINFLDAQKKYERRKSMEVKRKRGKEILNMIRLDSCSFTLFDLAPVPYETFIKRFGKGNTIQTACQTGEDNVDEETQTVDIDLSTKWTQEPPTFSSFDEKESNFWQKYKNDFLGVGGENVEIVEKNNFNEHSLRTFLASAGELILRLHQESNTDNNNTIKINEKTSSFSDGYFKFNTNKDIFADTEVSCVSFSCDISRKVMTVHSKNRASVVALWNIDNTEEPEAVFSSFGVVTCCLFAIVKSELIFTGLEDGTILIWDGRLKVFNETHVPLYLTDISYGHQTKIVALHILDVSSEESSYNRQANELCSLDEDGEIILWTIIQKHNGNNKVDEDNVVLIKNTCISLKTLHTELTDVQCTDFITSSLNTNYLFISTNYGSIIHHLVRGGRSCVKKFLPGSHSIANCLESCPFSSEYFLAGYDNGNINLYSRSSEKPLMILSDKDASSEYCPIELIQWSKNKPVVIYTKDAKNRLNIWYLNESDMFPIYTIQFEEEISCMKLSPPSRDDENKKSFMMIGTKTGCLYLYQLNEEHGSQPDQMYQENIRTFVNYVNRL